MANEVTTAVGSAGELVAAEIVSRLIIDAAYAQAVMPPSVESRIRPIDAVTGSALFASEKTWWRSSGRRSIG